MQRRRRTDFRNLPYAWDREVKKLVAMNLAPEGLSAMLHGTARDLFGLETTPGSHL